MNDTKSEKLVSVIMATYNCADYIVEAIDSVLGQTYSNWELIIIDDASNDNTSQLIATYDDSRIHKITNSINLGLARSLNRAIEFSNGEFLCRLDSDDIMLKDRIEKQIEYLAVQKDIAIVGANIIHYGGKNNGYITKFAEDSETLWAKLPFSSPIPHSSWMIRRDSFKEGFMYNPEFRSSQDYELMFRLFRSGKKIACLKEPLVKYRVRDDSISHKRKKSDPNTVKVQLQVVKMLKIKNADRCIKAINNEVGRSKLSTRITALWYLFVIWFKNMYLGVFKRSALTIEIAKRQYAVIRN